MQIVSSIIPIFMVIAVGYFMKRNPLFKKDTWVAVGNICFYVLFPCMIIKTLSTANLGQLPVTGLTFAMLGTTFISTAILIGGKRLFCYIFELSDASFTSLFQGIIRWHGFMAIAIVTGLFGEDALPVIALAVALLVPIINIINVFVHLIWGENGGDKGERPSIIQGLISNPFIWACFVGVTINLSGIPLPKMIIDWLTIISGGALGLSLLAIGAGLQLSELKNTRLTILCSVVFRLVALPLIMFWLTRIAGIDGIEQTVAVIAAAVPTASASYVSSQKMGGDAQLMANIIAVQFLIAIISLPLAIYLAEAY